ncbi:MFS transporter [Lentisphaera profundi]|uniref:MFS transporter n=1 Tax=Lentisphaera profundi TaxID=1658616 RepID=A0ABY7VWG6_9BACT|nr:MFS transporter [Lentisphaera profundi]WDE98432.1 MFS transporter [Lentisphaera profundi]
MTPQTRRLMPVALANFFGTLNDNAFKNVAYLAMAASITDSSKELVLNARVSIVFTIPFIIFSVIAGWAGDKFSRDKVMRFAKACEFPIMLVGAIAIMAYDSKAPNPILGGLLYSCVFLMALQSTFFVPARASIMPQLFNEQEIKDANGKLELLNFAGIILGTALAILCVAIKEVTFILPIFAIAGWLFIRKTEKVPAANPDLPFSLNPIKELAGPMKTLFGNKGLLASTVAETIFYSIGLVLVFSIFNLGKYELHLDDTGRSLLLLPLTFGIGLGCFIAGRVNHTTMNRGLCVPGLMGMTFSLCQLISCSSPVMAGVWILFAGFFGGLFILPVKVYLQEETPQNERVRIMAAENIIVFIGMLLTTWITFEFGKRSDNITTYMVIWSCASILALTSIAAACVLSNNFLRLIVLGPIRLHYRIKVRGLENVPHEGPLLLLPNHSTWIDGFLISAAVPRNIVFMIDSVYYNKPLLKPFFEMFDFLPVNAGRKSVLQSLEAGKQALADGKALCLFPEGVLTRSGFMNEFKSGFQRVLKGNDQATVLPVYMGGTWGSTFSLRGGERISFSNTTGPLPPKISVHVGEAVAHDLPALDLWEKVKELEFIDHKIRADENVPGPVKFLHYAKLKPFGSIFIDPEKGPIKNLPLLIKILALSAKIKKIQGKKEYTSILLPNTVAAVSSALAAYYQESIPVFLNSTVSKDGLAHALKTTDCQHVITSKLAIKKMNIDLPESCTPIYLEDIAKSIGKIDVLKALLSIARPSHWICKAKIDDTATILFSSGSTGTPKGVELTHLNVSSNLDSLGTVCDLNDKDIVLGHMPLFHAFGFLSAFYLPISHGTPTVMQANPLDAKAVSHNMGKYNCTLLFATPSFLANYTRRCKEEDFNKLRLVLVGAEKLNSNTAQEFFDKFGILPTEAYGATELAPGISFNAPVKIWELGKKNLRENSVGRPLPGIQVKTVNPDTLEDLSNGVAGLLLVRSPSTMRGYLKDPDRTKAVLKNGWYITGDIASINRDGSIQLQGRLSRFSKIAGEMVPHGAVEEALYQETGTDSSQLAVMGVPDEARGEKLVVLFTALPKEINDLIDTLRNNGLPNLWIPKPQNFIKIEEIPLLGSGKIDLKALKDLAIKMVGGID